MKKTQSKTTEFMKKNAIYFVMGLCIIAIGFSILYMVLPVDNDLTNKPDVDVSTPIEPDDTDEGSDIPDDEPVQKPVVFIMPVSSPDSIVEYTETMVWSSTMSRYSAHLAIDFFAPEGTDVLAVYDGTVESVENTLLTGYTVTINHGNGLKTVYNSLADGDCVVVGQTVKSGDVIGQVSVTNRQEYKSGAHLHFETVENGEKINPEKYLDLDNK